MRASYYNKIIVLYSHRLYYNTSVVFTLSHVAAAAKTGNDNWLRGNFRVIRKRWEHSSRWRWLQDGEGPVLFFIISCEVFIMRRLIVL